MNDAWTRGTFKTQMTTGTATQDGWVLRNTFGAYKAGGGYFLIELHSGKSIVHKPLLREVRALGLQLLALYGADGQMRPGTWDTFVSIMRGDQLVSPKVKPDVEVRPERLTLRDAPTNAADPLPVTLLQLRRFAEKHASMVGPNRYRFVRSHTTSVEVYLDNDAALYGTCRNAGVVYEALDAIEWAMQGFAPAMNRADVIAAVEAA